MYLSTSPSAECVRLKGLEPSRREAPDPKSGVSTNFTTGAWQINHYQILRGKDKEVSGYNQIFLDECLEGREEEVLSEEEKVTDG